MEYEIPPKKQSCLKCPAHIIASGAVLFDKSFYDDGNTATVQYTALIAQLVKNPPAIQETLVPFLGWEDPLEKG